MVVAQPALAEGRYWLEAIHLAARRLPTASSLSRTLDLASRSKSIVLKIRREGVHASGLVGAGEGNPSVYPMGVEHSMRSIQRASILLGFSHDGYAP